MKEALDTLAQWAMAKPGDALALAFVVVFFLGIAWRGGFRE